MADALNRSRHSDLFGGVCSELWADMADVVGWGWGVGEKGRGEGDKRGGGGA